MHAQLAGKLAVQINILLATDLNQDFFIKVEEIYKHNDNIPRFAW
jgi:hypothetical protein